MSDLKNRTKKKSYILNSSIAKPKKNSTLTSIPSNSNFITGTKASSTAYERGQQLQYINNPFKGVILYHSYVPM